MKNYENDGVVLSVIKEILYHSEKSESDDLKDIEVVIKSYREMNKQPLPEPEGMDEIAEMAWKKFSSVHVDAFLMNGDEYQDAVKYILQALSTRSEGWSDEEVWEMFTNFTETNKGDEWWKARFFEWIKDYKLKKGK